MCFVDRLGSSPEINICCTSLTIAGPTVLQFAWNNPTEKPSRPGALSLWIENIASRISLGEGSLVSLSFVALEMLGIRASKATDKLLPPWEVNNFSKYSLIVFVILSSV